MSAKKRILRAAILLLPVLGILLAVKYHPTGAPALRPGVALRRDALDFSQTSEPPIVLKRRVRRASAAPAAQRLSGQPQPSVERLSSGKDGLRPDLTWTQGMFVLGARSQTGAGWQ